MAKSIICHPAGIYLLKVNNRNSTTSCEKCSKLTMKAPDLHAQGIFLHVQGIFTSEIQRGGRHSSPKLTEPQKTKYKLSDLKVKLKKVS